MPVYGAAKKRCRVDGIGVVQYAARLAYAAETDAEAAAADARAPANGENADFGCRLSSQTSTSMADTTSPATHGQILSVSLFLLFLSVSLGVRRKSGSEIDFLGRDICGLRR